MSKLREVMADPWKSLRKFRDEVKGRLDPQKLYYESQKLRMRTVRFVESVEQLTGARPGAKLQVNIRGTERLEDNVRRAGRAAPGPATGAMLHWAA